MLAPNSPLRAQVTALARVCYHSPLLCYAKKHPSMETEFVTVRLTRDEADAMRRLREITGLSKTEIIRKALRTLASDRSELAEGVGLFDLGASRFGKYGDAKRQSSKIGQIARTRANAKRTGR